MQLTVQAEPAQVMRPHEELPEHEMSQLVALPQSIPCMHEEGPAQVTLQGMPGGQCTMPEQASAPPQFMTQVPF